MKVDGHRLQMYRQTTEVMDRLFIQGVNIQMKADIEEWKTKTRRQEKSKIKQIYEISVINDQKH